jgi:hypothetical protein
VTKYRAVPVVLDGIRFASKTEAARYAELLMLERGGIIADLELQPEYVLVPPFTDRNGKKHRGVKYRADFRYLRLTDNARVVEDVKGMATPVYKLKRELLLYQHPDMVFEEVRL